jgi:hypothetical protein
MLPSVTKARYVRDYLIEVKFNDDAKKVIDFEPVAHRTDFQTFEEQTLLQEIFYRWSDRRLAQWRGHCAD